MIKGKLAKKIMTISIATTMLSSFAISATAEEPLSDTLEGEPAVESEIENPVVIDWDAYRTVESSVTSLFTEAERDDLYQHGIWYGNIASEIGHADASFDDLANLFLYKGRFDKITEIYKAKYTNRYNVNSNYIALRGLYQDIAESVGYEDDCKTLDEVLRACEALEDVNTLTQKAENGDLSVEEFETIETIYNKFRTLVSPFQDTFDDVIQRLSGIMETAVKNSMDVQTDIKLFRKEHKVLAKGVDEVTLDDAEAVKTALDEYDGFTAPSKYGLREEKEILDALKAKIDALQAEADAKAAEEEAARKAAEEEAARKVAEEEAARKAAEEAAKTVSDSDVQTPDDGATSGGKEDTKPVSDSDATSGDAATTDDKDKDKDKGKDKDSVTDIETGEADYLLPSLISMASSALGYAGMLFKRKKSM